MTLNLLHFSNTANTIILLATTLAAILAIWKIIIPVFLFMSDWFKDLHDQSHLIKTMAAEFKPNGGSSLRDSVNRLETKVEQIKDMTDRTQAKQWALVATQKDPVFETNAEGECVRLNIMYMNLVERSIEELKGYNWENILHADDRDRVIEEWKDAIKKSRSFESNYKIVATVSKRVYRVHCVANPYFNTTGEILGYIGRFIQIQELTTI